jgi:hypothetical protein
MGYVMFFYFWDLGFCCERFLCRWLELFFMDFFLLIIILGRKEFEMRKKYDNPALLTVNFAFDTRLLDLVANTY